MYNDTVLFLTILLATICSLALVCSLVYIYTLRSALTTYREDALQQHHLLSETETLLLDAIDGVQETLDRKKGNDTENILLLAHLDNWEIDSVYDDVADRLYVYEPNTKHPMDYAIDISLREDTTYTVVVPQHIHRAIERMLEAREGLQTLSDNEASQRPYKADKPRVAPATAPQTPVIDKTTVAVMNPALIAALERTQGVPT